MAASLSRQVAVDVCSVLLSRREEVVLEKCDITVNIVDLSCDILCVLFDVGSMDVF